MKLVLLSLFLLSLFLLSLFLPTNNAHAFRLITNTGAGFNSKSVKIFVTSNSSCSNAGITNTELLNIAVDGANNFWNKVPTSNLRIKRGGILQTSDTKFLTEKLCASDSVTTCDPSTSVPTVTNIVIACNSNTTDNFPSSDYLALSGPNNVSGGSIRGSVVLINDTASSLFKNLSRAEKESVLAHEIGHAVGLGHSNKNYALMYYQNSDKLFRLSQDDIDGISYLYPNRLDGCSGIFGGTISSDTTNSIDPNDSGNSPLQLNYLLTMLIGLSIGYLLLIIAKFFTNRRFLLDFQIQLK